MSRTFEIPTKPYGGERLFLHRHVTFYPGVSILVGCNGSGKTTMLMLIEDRLKKLHISFVSYDNLFDGGHNAIDRYAYHDQLNLVSLGFTSSEGENIRMNLGEFARSIRPIIREAYENGKHEAWILLDAVDSGLSINNIVELDELFSLIIEDARSSFGVNVYIIAAANEFELVRRGHAFNIWSGKYVDLPTYESYYDFIMRSAAHKRARVEKMTEKETEDENRDRWGDVRHHEDCGNRKITV